MFALDQASTWEYKMPSWTGGYNYVAGLADSASDIVWSVTKAVSDPVSKEVNRVQNQASLLYNQGKSGVFSFIADTLESKNAAVAGIGDKVTSTTTAILSPLSSGLKWAMFLIVIGIAIYALAVVGPFLPKPSYGGRRG